MDTGKCELSFLNEVLSFSDDELIIRTDAGKNIVRYVKAGSPKGKLNPAREIDDDGNII